MLVQLLISVKFQTVPDQSTTPFCTDSQVANVGLLSCIQYRMYLVVVLISLIIMFFLTMQLFPLPLNLL